MSNYDSQNLGNDIAGQAANLGKSGAKKGARKLIGKAGGAAGKAIKKLVANFIKHVVMSLLKAIIAYLGPIGLVILICALMILIVLSSIPVGDWMMGGGSRDASAMEADAKYTQEYKDLSDKSVAEIDQIQANPDWKTTFKQVIQPSWGIPAALAKYQLIASEAHIELPNPDGMFTQLQPTFTYSTVTTDVSRRRVVTRCTTSDGGSSSDSYTQTTPRPPHKVLSAVSTPYGDVTIPPLKRYYTGNDSAEKIRNNGGSVSSNVWSIESSSTSESTVSEGVTQSCTTTVYFQYEDTQVDDRGIIPLTIDPDRLKNILLAKGVSEGDIPLVFEMIAAADPAFPLTQFSGSNPNSIPGVLTSGYVTPVDVPVGVIKDGWTWPAPAALVITSPYGNRGEFHYGVDLAGANVRGTPIVAAHDGLVVVAGGVSGYGIAVYIAHDDGLQTRYGHMDALTVYPGQQVKVGQQVGILGSTGQSSGPHLHFEVNHNGRNVGARLAPFDPMLILSQLK